jgi:hypothetical protein
MMFYDGESLRPWFDSGKIVNIESFDIATSHEELGFKFKHLGRLYDVFQWPDTIRVDSGGEDRSKDYDVNGEKAFLFSLLDHISAMFSQALNSFGAGVIKRRHVFF